MKKVFGNKHTAAGALGRLGFWFLAVVYLELVVHLAVFGAPELKFGYVLGFSIAFACLLALITSAVPGKANFWVTLVLLAVITVLYGSQVVYYFAFGNLYSVAQMQMGGAAVTSFLRETLMTMWNNLPWILALLVPLAVLAALRLAVKKPVPKANLSWAAVTAAVMVLAFLLMPLCLPLGGTGYFTDHYFYHSDTTTTDQAAERFGLFTAFRLELTGGNSGSENAGSSYQLEETQPSEAPAETVPEETAPRVEYNVLNIDFAKLEETTTDESLLALNQYVQSLPGTNKNEYTGMLRDYNLIYICAEAFATGVIDEELTPTLYRLANEGIILSNFYNTYPNNTTDGEYTLCTGLYPDVTRSKTSASMYASRNSYLPYCLGNIFREQRGVESYGYHNHIASYYGRDETHPNMGYSMKFSDDGLDLKYEKPTSDLDTVVQTVDDYISSTEQFHAYYMTFSGHMIYQRGHNAMADKNWGLVEHLKEYDDMTKCYLACNIELDRALEHLLQRLEEAGVAEKTAIVMVGDHYPYGLYDTQYEKLVGYELDNFNRAKSTAIFWVGGLEENIVVDEYCCNADILPTVLNLWGFDYDSRLLAGTDIFSDGEHIAILRDMSFFTDKVWLDASTGEIRYQVPESEVPEGYVDRLIRLVQNKFTMSADILNKAYYNYVYEAGEVTVDREVWGVDPDEAVVIPPKEEPAEPEEPGEAEQPQPSAPSGGEPPAEPEPPAPEPENPTPEPEAPAPEEPAPADPAPPAPEAGGEG